MMTGYCRGFKRLAVTLACSNRRVSATTFPSPSIMRAASTGEPPPSRTCNLSWTILCACPGVTLGVGMLTVTLVARGTPPNSSSCYSHKDSHFATCRCHCRKRLLRRGIAAASDWLTIGGGVGMRMSGPHVALCARISATPGFTCPSPSGVCSLAADSDSQLYGVGLVIMASLRIRPTRTCSAVKLRAATRNACCVASCHIGKTLTFLC
jgi:hypothetical protein